METALISVTIRELPQGTKHFTQHGHYGGGSLTSHSPIGHLHPGLLCPPGSSRRPGMQTQHLAQAPGLTNSHVFTTRDDKTRVTMEGGLRQCNLNTGSHRYSHTGGWLPSGGFPWHPSPPETMAGRLLRGHLNKRLPLGPGPSSWPPARPHLPSAAVRADRPQFSHRVGRTGLVLSHR